MYAYYNPNKQTNARTPAKTPQDTSKDTNGATGGATDGATGGATNGATHGWETAATKTRSPRGPLPGHRWIKAKTPAGTPPGQHKGARATGHTAQAMTPSGYCAQLRTRVTNTARDFAVGRMHEGLAPAPPIWHRQRRGVGSWKFYSPSDVAWEQRQVWSKLPADFRSQPGAPGPEVEREHCCG